MHRLLRLPAVYLMMAGLAHAAPSANQNALVEYLKGPKEPTIKDAVWIKDDILYVGVINDGTDRSGLADYVCMVAKERGAPASVVKVIDIVKVVRTGKFPELGKSYCK